MPKTNILIIDPADFIGGAELFTIDLLKKVDHEKFEVFLATLRKREYLKKIDTKKIHIRKIRIKRIKFFSLKALKNLFHAISDIKKIIKKEKIDVVQSNSIRAHIVAAIALFFKRKKLIWIVNDFTFPKFFARILSKIPYKIGTCSDIVRKDIKNKIPKRRHKKLCIIHSGIDLNNNKFAPFNIKKKFDLKKDAKLVGIVGRIDVWKGQDIFIRAASKVAAQMPHVRFLIIGEPSKYDPKTEKFNKKLKTLIEDLNLKKEVIFVGFQENIKGIMHELDILVHASTDPEPFGRTIIEGMACEVPVIATNIGGPKKIIHNNIDGILIPPKDSEELARKICLLLRKEKLREKLIKNANRTLQKRYNLAKIVRKIEKIWGE